jgi:hypothetical protein
MGGLCPAPPTRPPVLTARLLTRASLRITGLAALPSAECASCRTGRGTHVGDGFRCNPPGRHHVVPVAALSGGGASLSLGPAALAGCLPAPPFRRAGVRRAVERVLDGRRGAQVQEAASAPVDLDGGVRHLMGGSQGKPERGSGLARGAEQQRTTRVQQVGIAGLPPLAIRISH